MHRLTGQPSFVDAFIDAEGLGRNPDLEAIEAAIDWDRVTTLVASIHAAPEGRPGYPPGVMVKALLLQQWHELSDPRLEFALRDSLSFRRFVGLSAQDASPDHSSISRFRKALGERGLDAALFCEIARQLDAQGLMLKSGTILDASWCVRRRRSRQWVKARGRVPASIRTPTGDAADRAAACLATKPISGSISARV